MLASLTTRFVGAGIVESLPVCALAGLTIVLGFFHSSASAEEFALPVRSIDEIADGPMPQMTEITSSDAVLVFRSNIPLACSAVYGETEAFGLIATDQDMAGGAHDDHHPTIAGLKPATEYFFRVQGTAADGTLYVGEVQSFRTLGAAINQPSGLALLDAGARVASVSSNYGGAGNDEPWGADNAIDGNRRTAWSSAGDGDDAFVEIELAEATHIVEVSVWTRSMSDGTARILKFTLTTDRGTVHGPFALPDADKPYQFAIDDTARTLRLDVIESTGGNVGLIEFAVIGR